MPSSMQAYRPVFGAKYALEPETSTVVEITGPDGNESRKPVGKYAGSLVVLPEGSTSLAKAISMAACLLESSGGKVSSIAILDDRGKTPLHGRKEQPQLTKKMLEFHLITPISEPPISRETICRDSKS